MAIRFYSWPRSSGARVQWALEELGIPYESITVDRANKEHKGAAFLAINPNGKVPALVDDGERYFESAAILLHLGEKYGVSRKLWPASGQDRADALSWTVWAYTELNYAMRESIYHGADSPISYKPEDRSKAAGEFNRGQTERCLDMLEQRLANREYVCGSFTLADVAIGATLRFGTNFGLKLEGRPNVSAYAERLTKRPAATRLQ